LVRLEFKPSSSLPTSCDCCVLCSVRRVGVIEVEGS
jgi:hypothetical protein